MDFFELVILDLNFYQSLLLWKCISPPSPIHTHTHIHIDLVNIGTYCSKICLVSVVRGTHRKEIHDKTRMVQLHF